MRKGVKSKPLPMISPFLSRSAGSQGRIFQSLFRRNTAHSPLRPVRGFESRTRCRAESGSGITPNGYEYREYKNWRGIPKPRRCPFCKEAKGVIRRSRGGFLGVCPNCHASGPKRETHEGALRTWNGKGNL